MEILHSENVDNWSTEVSCGHCQAKLRIRESDVQYKYEYDDDGDVVESFYVNCPVCMYPTPNSPYAADIKIPTLVQDRAKRRCWATEERRHKKEGIGGCGCIIVITLIAIIIGYVIYRFYR